MTMNQPAPSSRAALKLARPMSVAIYDEYSDAAHAVDYLADRQFPVEKLAIVGTDLKSIEKVTGNITWGKVLLSGFLQGFMWAGMFALFMWLFMPGMSLVNALLIGMAGFGLVGMAMAAIQYRMRGGERDYTSTTQIIATHYEVLAEAEAADRARHLLSGGQAHRTHDSQPASGAREQAPGGATAVDLSSFPPPFGQQPTGTSPGQEAPGSSRADPGGQRLGSQESGARRSGPPPSDQRPGWDGQPPQHPYGAQDPYAQQPYRSQMPRPEQQTAPADQPRAPRGEEANQAAAALPYGQYWGSHEPPGIGGIPQSFEHPDDAEGDQGRTGGGA